LPLDCAGRDGGQTVVEAERMTREHAASASDQLMEQGLVE
jgi:hypothetical protein